jgi:HEAT repeat protein
MRNVAASLSSYGDAKSEAALIKVLGHPEELVRRQAASSLTAIRQRGRGVGDEET